jgi:hypothetical protein
VPIEEGTGTLPAPVGVGQRPRRRTGCRVGDHQNDRKLCGLDPTTREVTTLRIGERSRPWGSIGAARRIWVLVAKGHKNPPQIRRDWAGRGNAGPAGHRPSRSGRSRSGWLLPHWTGGATTARASEDLRLAPDPSRQNGEPREGLGRCGALWWPTPRRSADSPRHSPFGSRTTSFQPPPLDQGQGQG